MAASLHQRGAPSRGRRQPLIVEMIGTPGSGKTTGSPGIHAALRRAGWDTHTPEGGARVVVGRTALGRRVTRLERDRAVSVILWRLYLLHRWVAMVRAVIRRPGHFLGVIRYQSRRPAGALVRRRRVLYWYLRTVGAQEFFRRHAHPGEAIVFEEGRVHRVVQLFSSPVDAASPTDVRRCLAGVPRPDLVVALACPVPVCVRRVRSRGVWDRLSGLSEESLARFVANAGRVVEETVDFLAADGWSLVEVDGESVTAATLESRVGKAVAAALASPGEGRVPARMLYGSVLPRPRQLVRRARGRVSAPAIAVSTLDVLLAQLGASRTGRAGNLPLGRRSDSVWVGTDRGRMVVRAYSDHWPDAAIEHEHSVLRYLEEQGYPAVRLVAAADGSSVFSVHGRRMAAFHFAPGTNLNGSYMSTRAALDAIHLAGGLLARLHAATAEFHPRGSHHLELDSSDGDSRLRSQLRLLGELAASSDHPDAAVLGGQAGEVAERLTHLHEVLTAAQPESAVIHGDFGLHNILFRRDGTATVHDFELARRDWRVIDVIEALGSMPRPGRRALLAGYRLEV
ncbi:MAG: phosphotransferase enzyme family protein, partial [Actinomycetota bacterium]